MESKKCKSTAIKRHSKVLGKLEEERIISVIRKSDGFYIFEKCDEYFCHKLTEEECMDLSELFSEMASEMENS